MAPQVVSYGKCFLCGGTFAKNAMTRHLKACVRKHETAQEGKPVRLFHLRVEGKYAPEYWLHLEIPASATLAALDDFLRAIWLECCDHMSAFTIKGADYERDTGAGHAMWTGFFGSPLPTESMSCKLYSVLSPGVVFVHEYDFGTTTTLTLKVVGERQGSVPEEKIRVLARNYAPSIPCALCDKQAEWVYAFDFPPTPYCAAHAEEHEDWEEGFLPVVNSPRVGQCGYTGAGDKRLVFEEQAPAVQD
ncbi:MAG: hypothetical protein H5T65_11005 [Chloroflexi bacterium]|nr:hypothetical protein [Chloroflexota bacterium]